MLLQVSALADSVAVHDAAVKLGNTLAGWLVTHVFTGLPESVAAALAIGVGTLFGLVAAWIWHRVWVFVHGNSTAAAQAKMRAWWGQWGKWIGTLAAALIAGATSGNWAAVLLPVLAHLPSAAFGGASSVLLNQNADAVKAGRVGALVLLLGALALCTPSPARAAVPLLEQPSVAGKALPFLSWQRTVFTVAAGEAWTGPKATDHPTPYGRLGGGYQVSAPVQVYGGFRRDLVTGSTWRFETEVKLIFAP